MILLSLKLNMKLNYLISSHSEYKDKLDYVIVEDMGKPGAYSGLLNDITGVFNVASPFVLKVLCSLLFYIENLIPNFFFSCQKLIFMKVEDNLRDTINPAVNGMVNLLTEAAKVPTIKRVIITASFACLVNFANGN